MFSKSLVIILYPGLLFPGGGVDLSTNNTFTIAANHMYQLALQANANGDYFPLWVCLASLELCLIDLHRHNQGYLPGISAAVCAHWRTKCFDRRLQLRGSALTPDLHAIGEQQPDFLLISRRAPACHPNSFVHAETISPPNVDDSLQKM